MPTVLLNFGDQEHPDGGLIFGLQEYFQIPSGAPEIISQITSPQQAMQGSLFAINLALHISDATSYMAVDALGNVASLPPWLSIAGSILGGTPTMLGTFQGIRIRGSNDSGSVTLNPFDIVVSIPDNLVFEVRLLIGDIDEPYSLPDNIIQYVLARYQGKPFQVQTWCAALDSFDILIKKFAKDGSRRRERRGSEEIEEYRNERYNSYKSARKELLNRLPAGSSNPSTIIFGGVNRDEVERVYDDPTRYSIGPTSNWFNSEECNAYPTEGYTYISNFND